MLISFSMFAGEFRDRQVATGLVAGNSGESEVSDAVIFYAKA